MHGYSVIWFHGSRSSSQRDSRLGLMTSSAARLPPSQSLRCVGSSAGGRATRTSAAVASPESTCARRPCIVRSRWHSFECGDVSYRLALPLCIFTARRYASAVLAVLVCMCVRLSVCHKPVLYQNGYRYDHANNAAR